jgi:hypothetical protein
MASRDNSKDGQSHNTSHSAPYSSEEKRYVKDNWGSEYHVLRNHGLSIYKDEDREEGRSIVRALKEMDLEDEKEQRSERDHGDAKSGKESEAKHYSREYDDVAREGDSDGGATRYEEQGTEDSDEDDVEAETGTAEYEDAEYDEDEWNDSSDDGGSYDDDESDDGNYDDGDYDDEDVDYDYYDDDDDAYEYDDYDDD